MSKLTCSVYRGQCNIPKWVNLRYQPNYVLFKLAARLFDFYNDNQISITL